MSASRGHENQRVEPTAVKVEAETPLPQVKLPLETAQLPLEVDIVKPEALPESV